MTSRTEKQYIALEDASITAAGSVSTGMLHTCFSVAQPDTVGQRDASIYKVHGFSA